MLKATFLCGALAISLVSPSLADTAKREALATRIEESPKIDGVLDDAVWQSSARIFNGAFTQIEPNNLELSEVATEVWFVYNDFGVYVAAHLHDPDAENIPSELGIRDDMDRNSDLFTFALDPYQNGQNGFHFLVTSAGVQGDAYMTNQGQNDDFSWDAVWNSAVGRTEEGWVVEIEIPYSAIRFPKQPAQTWNVNFIRRRAGKQEIAAWNPIDNAQNGFIPQFGTLSGIEDITPPPRIFLTPYVTAYANYDGSTETFGSAFTGGLDLKAGLNESFTLDMTLVPDFGQVRADNQVLNLGPFEIRFQENRPFFTEGTELFNQGPVFYSRRVGRTVGGLQEELGANEEVTYQPSEAPLLNATKITGRTPNGFGVGFFNAVTNKTFATVQDTVTGDTRQVQVDPLANYNVMVGEKTFGHNSRFTLINTNVTRFNYNRDANVTRGNLSYFLDEDNTYRVNATGTWSHIDFGESATDGYAYNVGFNKVAGTFQFGVSRNVESADLMVNDFGFLNAPNEITHSARMSLNKFKPWLVFNRFNWNMGTNFSQMWDDKGWTNRGVWTNLGGQLKNFWYVEAWGSVRGFQDRDYFGTFTAGRWLNKAPDYDFGAFVGTDDRKMVALRTYNYTWHRPDWDARDFGGGGNIRVRVNNKFNINYGLDYNIQGNQRGYTTRWTDGNGEEQIIFGIRDWRSLENSLRASYTFNNKMGLNLELRHYWARVQNKEMRQLDLNGDMVATEYNPMVYEYADNEGGTYKLEYLDPEGSLIREYNSHDLNFNAMNIYLTYNWQIAPGSFVNVVYQDVLTNVSDEAYMTFIPNFRNAATAPRNQSLSVRLIYFLDYLTIRNLF
ncbi:MAG: DUF5916 domain-containing protein [Bacteroidota bacterium]